MVLAGNWLIVRRHGRKVFADALAVRRGEIALTHRDAPYTIFLRKYRQEDAVHVIDDLLDTEMPMALESERLGIKLVADAVNLPDHL